ncbi:MAG: restriction endonuclease subunit S [Mariprofundaceae bacterium]|nr:restriction endonuclease subunit S [Mariprofundaceae bacterium]
MCDLPEGWKKSNFGEIAEVIMGQSPKGEECNTTGIGIPLLNGPTEFGAKTPIPVQFTTSARKVSEINDILFCVRGSTTGKMNWADQQYALGRGLAAIRHKEGGKYQTFVRGVMDNRLKSLLSCATGSTFPNVSRSQLEKMEILLPPLPEQKAIADMLSSFDEKIELLREQNKTLETLAQAIFKEWFVHFNYPDLSACGHAQADATGEMVDSELGLIPKGWRAGSLLEVFDLIGGGTPKTSIDEYWNGGIPWYSVVDAPKGSETFVIETEKNISSLGLSKSSTKLLSKGTSIVSARGTVGKLALVGRETAMNQSCYGVKGKGFFGDYYVYFQLKEALNSLKSRVHGAVFDTITQPTFKNIMVTLPDNEVVTSYEERVTPIMEKILNNVLQIQSLSKTRDTILPKLMSGNLRISIT